MQRFGSPTTVPGIPPPHAPGVGVPAGQLPPQSLFDFHPVINSSSIFLFAYLILKTFIPFWLLENIKIAFS